MSEVTNINEETKLTKAIHKRRSSFFRSRRTIHDSIGQNIDETDINEADKTQNLAQKSELEKEKTFNLHEYISNLKKERMSWRNTLKERKTQRRELVKKKSLIVTKGTNFNSNLLSDVQKSFIMARPNYKNICQNSKILSDLACQVAVLNQLSNKLNCALMTRIEEKLYSSTKIVIEMGEEYDMQ